MYIGCTGIVGDADRVMSAITHREGKGSGMSNVNADAANNPVKVYPNPSKGTVNIYAAEGGTYQISDMAGRLVRAGKLDGITQIDGLKSGVYTLTIQSGDDRYTQKLMVE